MNGDATELFVAARLQAADYQVSVPFSESCRYDLVVEGNKNFIRVQVKMGWRSAGGIKFKCHSGNGSKRDRMKYTKEDIDVFAVLDPKTEQIFWVPVEDTPKTTMKLRDPESLNTDKSARINFTTDYKFGE